MQRQQNNVDPNHGREHYLASSCKVFLEYTTISYIKHFEISVLSKIRYHSKEENIPLLFLPMTKTSKHENAGGRISLTVILQRFNRKYAIIIYKTNLGKNYL